MDNFHATTIIGVKTDTEVAIAGDGQVSFGNTILKGNAKKVRRIYNDQIIAGFAGSTADAMNLFEKLEGKLTKHRGNLLRSCLELAKDWRTDKILRKLEAMLIAADSEHLLLLTGNGDVVIPEENFIAIGSGGSYALASAKALVNNTSHLSAREIATKSIEIAGEICIYTNKSIVVETIEIKK